MERDGHLDGELCETAGPGMGASQGTQSLSVGAQRSLEGAAVARTTPMGAADSRLGGTLRRADAACGGALSRSLS
ncbi:hypothetical protein NDU88_003651 [Pleurodeles waltl]|uniref:Uncharacterized protein n=1 Tax=Pleurodeles waltl TaxID=8319 RepID=A0AAV7UDW9_PLEWA|nr:hypothetical protein NDU88_003651 [Pleurodeles waltl]